MGGSFQRVEKGIADCRKSAKPSPGGVSTPKQIGAAVVIRGNTVFCYLPYFP